MPDITMCRNSSCPLRLTCFRFIARPSEWQGYAGFDKDIDDCYTEAYRAEIEDYEKRLANERVAK